jgi:hypoxanthine phosphoribosyltransferase
LPERPGPRAGPGEHLRLLIPERRIRRAVHELARRIDADYRGKAPVLVIVLKGAAILAADLMRELATPVTIAFVAASSYRNSTRSAGEVAIGGVDSLEIGGRDVLLIEDILDTGLTTAALVERLRERRPASLSICVLLDKRNGRAADLPVGYAGIAIPDEFVVGYGMDFAERYRNLRAVYVLEFERP